MFFSGSIRLFDVAGTAVRVHPTFFMLLAWIGAVNWLQGGAQAALTGVVFILLLFGCVVLHEFGHVFAASMFGIRTPDVTLLPIGGVAALERMPEKPWQEIFVALAGPAVNVVIAAALILLVPAAQFGVDHMARLEDASSGLLPRLAAANVALVVFNLIPAFPMDGGRVLRALLAIPMGFSTATRVAATIGQVLAVGLGFLGLFGNPLLILVAVFIFLAATAEAGSVEMREATRAFLARDAMITQFERLSPMATADDAVELVLRTTQQEFPIVDGGGHIRGVLTRALLVQALQSRPGSTPVLEIMSGDVPTVPERASLEAVYRTLQQSQAPIVAVLDAVGRVVGYVTPENLSELVMLRAARAREREKAA